MRTLLALSLTMTAACAAKPAAEVRYGQARASGAPRVVLTPAVCSSVEGECTDEYVTGTTGKVASELEFRGYTIIDAETLVLGALERDTISVELREFGTRIAELRGQAQRGSVFEDLSPALRRELLQEARAEGVLSTRITIGPRNGVGPVRQNSVQVRLGLGDGGELAWVTRCSAESGFNPPVDQALASATSCALAAIAQ